MENEEVWQLVGIVLFTLSSHSCTTDVPKLTHAHTNGFYHSAPRRHSIGFDLEQQLGKLLAQFSNEDVTRDSPTVVELCLEAAQFAFERGFVSAAQDWMALLPRVIEVCMYM